MHWIIGIVVFLLLAPFLGCEEDPPDYTLMKQIDTLQATLCRTGAANIALRDSCLGADPLDKEQADLKEDGQTATAPTLSPPTSEPVGGSAPTGAQPLEQ